MPSESVHILKTLTLKRENVTDYCTFTSSYGDEIRVEYIPVHEVHELANRTLQKVVVGYRVKITITLYSYNYSKVDFLINAANERRVLIYDADPVTELEGKYLIFKKVEPVEIWSNTKYLIRAEAQLEELLPNIPPTYRPGGAGEV